MEDFLEINSPDRLKVMKKALKRAGLRIEEVDKKGNRTVITVRRKETDEIEAVNHGEPGMVESAAGDRYK